MHGTQRFEPALRSSIWPQPDQMLIESVAGGDKQALEQLFTRHSARIYRFVSEGEIITTISLFWLRVPQLAAEILVP